jgi:hypothetical protein
MIKLKDLDCLQGKFFIFSRPRVWRIECMNCDAKWELKKDSANPSTGNLGNILHLLNHSAGHELQRDNPAEYERIQQERKADQTEKMQKVNQELNRWLRGQLKC